MKRAAITIDVDSLRCYREIHGLPPSAEVTDPIYTVALPRFFELLAEIRAPATLFLIGADAPLYAASFGPARALGCEIGSHSFEHDYRLTSLSRDAIRSDLSRAHQALSIFGEIVGFRAPGYNTSEALFEVLADLRYSYDSSRLPSPPYFLARAAAIGAYAVLRRPSRSLVGSFSAFAGSLAPHHIGALIELPMACEPWTRVPFFGTSLTALPASLRGLLISRAIRTLPYVNFEMHALDLLDASETAPELAAAQRDLRIPVAEKMKAFHELFRVFRSECEVSTLRDIARAEAVF